MSKGNLGFKVTDHTICCPLCLQFVKAVRVGVMRWSYERCPNCLIAFDSKAWNDAWLRRRYNTERQKET